MNKNDRYSIYVHRKSLIMYLVWEYGFDGAWRILTGRAPLDKSGNLTECRLIEKDPRRKHFYRLRYMGFSDLRTQRIARQNACSVEKKIAYMQGRLQREMHWSGLEIVDNETGYRLT